MLRRDMEVGVAATTWSFLTVNGVGGRALVRESLDEGLDRFVNDWLAANVPASPPTP